MIEFFIGFEENKPFEVFFYKPVKLTTNLLVIELLSDHNLDPRKTYQFFFSLNGVNFSLKGKPLKFDRNRIVILIQDSSIEQRRYPRIYFKNKEIRVKIDSFVGWLRDFSIGGCRVKFDMPLPKSFYSQKVKKILEFYIPSGEKIKVKGILVNISDDFKESSYVFDKHDSAVIALYNKLINFLKRKEV